MFWYVLKLMVLLPLIFYPILAFGSASYTKPAPAS